MADGSSFWYAEGPPANTAIYKVDPLANAKTALFDIARLRKALSAVLEHEPPGEGLPFQDLTFLDDTEAAVTFGVEGRDFTLRLDTYSITPAPPASEGEKGLFVAQLARKGLGYPDLDLMEVLSPDGRWFAGLQDHNLWLRSTDDGRRVQLTTDGIEAVEWRDAPLRTYSRWISWSPDSRKLAAKKVDTRQVPKIPIVRYPDETGEVDWVDFPTAGAPRPQTTLFIVDLVSKRRTQVETGGEPDQYILLSGWRNDGSELLFHRVDRYWNHLDLMAANPETGSTRVIVTENRPKFSRGRGERYFTALERGDRFLWMSQRDGWDHLYLYNIDGTLIRQLTDGAFPVLQVITVDENAGWIYFTAHGDPTRPYDVHLYRVTLEGTNLTRLTEARGQHEIQFAPSKHFFLDKHSAVARPPAVELRRADGTLLQTLSRANVDALQELNWSPPEEFVVKAADGETDLYGVLYKPYDFDPTKTYPVMETIYGALSIVPHDFSQVVGTQARAQLGFITFIVDSRGTEGRGSEFRDVIYGNVGRIKIPDHVAALEQLAAQRPYMDLSRVGILGGSHGGYLTVRAMLLAPDVYHVGIAFSPLSDIAEHWALEPYMGPPEANREAYEYASNLVLAGNLQGKLLLTHGTGDVNVPFSHTIKMAHALIRAGKPFDLLVLPGEGHESSGSARTYEREVLLRYLKQHFQPHSHAKH